MADRLRESALHFGPQGRLVGILTEPAQPRPGAPTVVILNAGIIHRVGPHRIHVRVARHLAGLGFTVLRIDQAGVGDSRPLGEGSPDDEALASIGEALTRVAPLVPVDSFVLFGLCAGAHYALRAAPTDPRVVGAVILDLPGLGLNSTPRHRVSQIARIAARSAVRPQVWVRAVKGRYDLTSKVMRSLESMTSRKPGEGELDDSPSEMALEIAREIFRTLDERGVRVFFGVTGAQREHYSYAGQIFDLFPELDLRRIIEPCMYPKSDHTFSNEVDRERLERDVGEWMERLAASLTATAERAPSQ